MYSFVKGFDIFYQAVHRLYIVIYLDAIFKNV